MESNQISKGRRWTSYSMSGLVILFMLMDGVFKFIVSPEVIDVNAQLGYTQHHLPVMGALALASALLYLIPRTSILGLVLLTGYYGGAIATHFRVDNPLFSHTLFPVYLAILAWGGIWLRNARLRALFPFQTSKTGDVQPGA